jgi:tellurite resistance protein TerC
MVTSLFKQARRIVIGIIGCTVLLIGIALLVLPGPAFIVIPAGLAILAIEFAWARRWLEHIKQTATRTGDRFFRKSVDDQGQQADRV